MNAIIANHHAWSGYLLLCISYDLDSWGQLCGKAATASVQVSLQGKQIRSICVSDQWNYTRIAKDVIPHQLQEFISWEPGHMPAIKQQWFKPRDHWLCLVKGVEKQITKPTTNWRKCTACGPWDRQVLPIFATCMLRKKCHFDVVSAGGYLFVLLPFYQAGMLDT